MADFAPAFDYVMENEDPKREGHVVPEPEGGEAKYGINSIAHPEVDVPNLTLAGAEALYQNWYWKPIQGDVIGDQAVADKTLDIAFWLGVPRAGKYVQEVLNGFHPSAGLTVDGHIGPKTIFALNRATPELVLAGLRQLNAQHIQERAAEDPRIAAIKDGLLKRAEK